ncbi:MAG: hypothetical protein OQJ99_05405 [Rhodospirillales bacterium]|nr:hypothetical protein [Rhodospirillales bacterium]MCW8860805.1 hypothetical protein [Rhodospirillales bacterium]MCW8952069.1 hypothetical protein [Rhodospirillales bacterium]MCW8970018.1 hypothetical protein [Rhodospirillales bacterium]MCW9002448.1 hypothetical protein [Rhodospirillales bacterium]
MLKMISTALMSVFLDKKAREAVSNRSASRKTGKPARQRNDASPPSRGGAPPSREEDLEALRIKTDHLMTPERKEMLRNAMKVRAAKSKIIEDLDDEQKRKLYAMAMKALLNKDVEPR